MAKVIGKTAPERAEEGGEGRYDAVVVGAGTAGLSAALVLGRSRRRVLVLDGGEPRNAPAHASHGFFTRDGVRPGELLEIGRAQLEPYPGVEYRAERAAEVSGSDGAFEVALEDGETFSARKLVLATGVFDELPDRPGFPELWGRGVYHCPYCHGWEVRDRPPAVMGGDEVLERAVLIRNWRTDSPPPSPTTSSWSNASRSDHPVHSPKAASTSTGRSSAMSTDTGTATADLVKGPSAAGVSSARYAKLFARRSECRATGGCYQS